MDEHAQHEDTTPDTNSVPETVTTDTNSVPETVTPDNIAPDTDSVPETVTPEGTPDTDIGTRAVMPDLGISWREATLSDLRGERSGAAKEKRILRLGWHSAGQRPLRAGRRVPGRFFGLLDPSGRSRSRIAIAAFAALFFVVMAVTALAAWRGGTGFDVVRRRFRYGGADQSGGELYSYPYSARSRFAVLGDTLVVLSDTELCVLDGSGEELASENLRMGHPALSANGDRAVAWDAGGTELFVVDKAGTVTSLTATVDEPFLAASLNDNGLLCTVTGRRSGKSLVRVYDDQFRVLFDYNAGRLVSDACVTDDNLRLAAVTLGQEGDTIGSPTGNPIADRAEQDSGTDTETSIGADAGSVEAEEGETLTVEDTALEDTISVRGLPGFASGVVFYRLDQEEPEFFTPLSDALVLEIAQQGKLLTAVADTCISFLNPDTGAAVSWSYDGAHLRAYDLGGGGFAALLLRDNTAGDAGRLVTVDNTGELLGSLETDEEVLSVSAAGRYVAVLYANRLVVYTRQLQEYAVLAGTGHLRQILCRPDGSVLLLGALSGGVFLP